MLHQKIQILKDLAKALNFSYIINAPKDGFKWGGINENGEPFGLLADMRVGLVVGNPTTCWIQKSFFSLYLFNWYLSRML